MTPAPHTNRRDALTAAARELLEGQLPATEIVAIAPEMYRIRFRRADGRTGGDVEVLVTWDVAPTELVAVAQDGRSVSGREVNSGAAQPISNSSGLSDADVQRIADAVCAKLGTVQPPATSDTRYWSPERAAYECGVSERTFADWMAEGKVRYYKMGRRVLIDPQLLDEDLAKYLHRRLPKRRKRQSQRPATALAAPLLAN